MNQYADFNGAVSRFISHIEEVHKAHPISCGCIGVARAPATVDVMGGICEDAGALLLTATTALSYHVAAWQTADRRISIQYFPSDSNGPPLEFSLSSSDFKVAEHSAGEILLKCRGADAEWAAPSMLTLYRAMVHGILSARKGGLRLVMETDFPANVDWGHYSVQAAATIDAVCKSFDMNVDRLKQSRICGDAMIDLVGLNLVRKAVTALCAPAEGALLQLQLTPKLRYETLEMPPGIIIKALSTRLSRPITRKRLIETRTCSEMGHRMIMELQRQDGNVPNPETSLLSAITPAEYVSRYRDRMPSKITRQAFVNRFGTLRGLENGQDNPKAIYKIRSRAEHHIYENHRVHDFVSHVVRARRNTSGDDLHEAGELMYASHWSHSQRCGIGGVESDRLVSLIRCQGSTSGLFGAKITAGGEGGELVVLMRDDERARAALAEAVSQAEQASQKTIQVFEGSLPGAESFQAPDLAGFVDSAGTV